MGQSLVVVGQPNCRCAGMLQNAPVAGGGVPSQPYVGSHSSRKVVVYGSGESA